jgi:hypothetical protein
MSKSEYKRLSARGASGAEIAEHCRREGYRDGQRALRAALQAGEGDPYCLPDEDGHIHCPTCRECDSPAAVGTPRFKVGDKALRHGEEVTIEQRRTEYRVRHGDRGECATYWWYNEDELEPIPTLPADSLERHWVVGAWITSDRMEGRFLLVLNDEKAVEAKHVGVAHPRAVYRDNYEGEATTGWRFHPDSPIQEPAKVT